MSHNHKHAVHAPHGPTGQTTTTRPGAAHGDKDDNSQSISADDVRLCAYRKWESAGKPTGDGIRFWLEAEHELGQHK